MRAMVRDDFVTKAEAEKHFVEEKRCDSFHGDGFLHRAKNHPLSKLMVDHDQKRIEAREKGKVSNKVARDLLE